LNAEIVRADDFLNLQHSSTNLVANVRDAYSFSLERFQPTREEIQSVAQGTENWSIRSFGDLPEARRIKWLEEYPSAGAHLFRIPTPAPSVPQVAYHPSAKPMLTDKVKGFLTLLINELENIARKEFVILEKLEVSRFVDPEEATDELIITQWVMLPEYLALNYWDRLGMRVELWLKRLPQKMKEEIYPIMDKVSLAVRWNHGE